MSVGGVGGGKRGRSEARASNGKKETGTVDSERGTDSDSNMEKKIR